MTHILLIDDEPAITESLAYAFSKVGMTSESANSLGQATERLNASAFDLIILDLMLPDGNGLDWLRAVRAESDIPVIILSSHDETVDQVVGLEVGADDYVGKPFSPRAVIARVRAVLRRTHKVVHDPSAGVRVDLERRQVYVDDIPIAVSRTEFDLLDLFMANPGRVLAREEILKGVWGPEVSVTERTVDVHIKSLRKKLVDAGLDEALIETVRGVGYRLAES
ncbi:MAG: response regulator transcription factor [Bradymonadia bacterium]